MAVLLAVTGASSNAVAQEGGGINGRLQGGGYGHGMQGMGRDFRDNINLYKLKKPACGAGNTVDKETDSNKDSSDSNDSANDDADNTAKDLARDDIQLDSEADRLWNQVQSPKKSTSSDQDNKIQKDQ